jgi:hypothetical protein
VIDALHKRGHGLSATPPFVADLSVAQWSVRVRRQYLSAIIASCAAVPGTADDGPELSHLIGRGHERLHGPQLGVHKLTNTTNKSAGRAHWGRQPCLPTKRERGIILGAWIVTIKPSGNLTAQPDK